MNWTCILGLLMAAPAGTLLAPPQQDKDQKEETREVRVYLIDRMVPDRDFKDAVAILTIDRPFGRSQTFLLPRVSKKGTPTPGEKIAPGAIRALLATPYFVELNLGDAAPAAPQDEVMKPGTGKEAPKPPSGREILRRVHQGAYFGRKIPVSALSDPFAATVTIRLGDLTFTSEEFQGPRGSDEAPEGLVERVDCSLEILRSRAENQAGFMDLRPAVVELIRELSKLAPAGFEDGTGTFELDRQWCLAHARAIERACYEGNTGRVLDLSTKCGPRLKEMQSILAEGRKEAPPAPKPEPEVPTVK